jgi:flagella synthesis protein FlgN
MNNNDLQHLLEDDRQQLGHLLEVLQAERKALESRDLDTLSTLLTEKQTLLARIGTNDHDRRQLLRGAGVPPERTSLAQLKLLLRNSTDPGVTTLLDTIEQLVTSCRELTETNGIIVHRSRLNTEKALNILRGNQPVSTLYTSHGNTQGGSIKRDLGNA